MRAKVHAFFMIASPESIDAGMPLTGILSLPNVLAPRLASRFVGRFRREIRSRVSMSIRRLSFFILLRGAVANHSRML